MKQVAVIILIVVVSGFILQPITEFGLVLTEKIQLESSLGNAIEVAKAESLVYEDIRQLNAVVDENKFRQAFIDVFETGLNVSHNETVGNILTFRSNDGKRNSIVVEIQFVEQTEVLTNKVTTTVTAKASTVYKLKTNYLKIASDAGEDVDYTLVGEKSKIISVEN